MLNRYFKNLSTLKKYQDGPAGSYLDRFIDWFEARGYRRHCIRRHIRGADHFVRWAERSGLTGQQLDANALEVFGKHLQKRRLLTYTTGSLNHTFIGARHFIAFLQASGEVAPSVSPPAPAEPELLMDFRCWMKTHRGTMDATLTNYRRVIVDFLDTLGDQPEQYHAEALRTFVLDRASRCGIGNAKNVVTAVRMFLRFLSAMGRCTPGLDYAIPTIARWRLAALPKYLSAEAVEQVIASCDLSTRIGVRDRAVLLLLARLGLRAGDIAGLKLTAIDWQAGTVQVAGKNRREARLPLPQDAGDAVLAYLEQRPKVNDAYCFITAIAPFRHLSYQTVGQIVTRAIHRAGIKAPIHGAHVLRHSLATAMLREGVTLPTIGTLLRHASIETTAVYAKVDVPQLRQVARPWPEVTPC
jgi:integrase/recombinase XerD